MKGYWQRRSARERQWLKGAALLLAAVIGYLGLWLPAHQHLATVQARYQQQLQLQRVLASVGAQRGQPAPASLASLVSESAQRRAVLVREMSLAAGSVRLAASGEALALLAWLAELEQGGAQWQSLVLTREEEGLLVRMSLDDG
ncbi:type II secretion system protein GspM [Pseudomonas sp. App30]|uniref:type II secretion system protein GspM n=1 Tax=Pseudomonas sp. App30 TaxID=3068990 RepID=UPI003A80FD53